MNNLTPAMATVIAACLSGFVTLVVCLVTIRSQNKRHSDEVRERDAERNKAEAVRDARLGMWMGQVDKKLDQHNGYAERFAEIGEDIAAIKTDIKNLYRKGA